MFMMNEFFKGFIPTGGDDGKRPLEKYKNRTDFYNLKDVEKLNSYGGVLKNGIVQIDIDNKEDSERVYKIIKALNINCIVLNTTRGKHFYFKNTKVNGRKQGWFTPIGIKVDTGLGDQNAVIPLKVLGRKRRFIKITPIDTLEELPYWLFPVQKNNFIDFKTLKQGDGRNQTLFNYILTLQKQGFTKEIIKEIIRIINEFVLLEPLDKKEVDTILRDEAFLKDTFYIKNSLQYEKLARFLLENENIIKINDILHIYKNGVYESDDLYIERIMLKYIKNSTKTLRSEVIRYLELLGKNCDLESPKLVLLNNGVYDLETGILSSFSPKLIIKNKLPIDYNPSATNDLVDKTLDKISCNDPNLKLLIEEMIGYTLLRRNEMGKCFILTGNGSNGKSTILAMINKLLGDRNISSVSLEELNHRFKTYQLEGKLANIGDDISNKYIDDNSTFKKLVTGEKVNVERKGMDPFDLKNYSKLIFSANELPQINDLSNGLKRRLIFIPFNAHFSKKDPDFDPFIKDKLLKNDALEYLLLLALKGLNRILYNQEFTTSNASTKVWKDYEALNNPVITFIEEHKIENEITENVYRKYTYWCQENGLKAHSKIVFSREVCKRGFNSNKSIRANGVRKRIYSSSN